MSSLLFFLLFACVYTVTTLRSRATHDSYSIHLGISRSFRLNVLHEFHILTSWTYTFFDATNQKNYEQKYGKKLLFTLNGLKTSIKITEAILTPKTDTMKRNKQCLSTHSYYICENWEFFRLSITNELAFVKCAVISNDETTTKCINFIKSVELILHNCVSLHLNANNFISVFDELAFLFLAQK